MIFKIQKLEETVLLIRCYNDETTDKYCCVGTLHRPKGKKKWQVLGFLSKERSAKKAKEVLEFLKNFPEGTYTYVSEKDFNRFYKKHNYKQIEL